MPTINEGENAKPQSPHKSIKILAMSSL